MVRPSYASNRPKRRHMSSRSVVGAVGSATRSTNEERLCSTPTRIAWPFGPSSSRAYSG